MRIENFIEQVKDTTVYRLLRMWLVISGSFYPFIGDHSSHCSLRKHLNEPVSVKIISFPDCMNGLIDYTTVYYKIFVEKTFRIISAD